jgi:hypothetical protein
MPGFAGQCFGLRYRLFFARGPLTPTWHVVTDTLAEHIISAGLLLCFLPEDGSSSTSGSPGFSGLPLEYSNGNRHCNRKGYDYKGNTCNSRSFNCNSRSVCCNTQGGGTTFFVIVYV